MYLSNIHGYLYEVGDTFKLLHYQIAVIGLGLLALVTRYEWIMPRIPQPIIYWLGAFLILVLISFFRSTQTDAAVEQMIFGFKTAALLFSFVVLVAGEGRTRAMMNLLIGVTLLLVALNIYDFFNPTFSSSSGRAAGFHQNSNATGKVIAITMVLAASSVPARLRIAFCMVAGIGILLTFSRSALLLWTIGMVGLAATGALGVRSRLAYAAGIVVACLAIVAAIYSGLMLTVFETLGLDQYLTRGTLSRLGGAAASLQDASATGRINAIWYSLGEFSKFPWLGAGLGATSEWISLQRPHNLYLMLAVEAGMLGVLVFVSLLLILWRSVNSTGRVVVFMYAVSSFFTHNNLEHPATLCLLALVLALYPSSERSFKAAAAYPESSRLRVAR